MDNGHPNRAGWRKRKIYWNFQKFMARMILLRLDTDRSRLIRIWRIYISSMQVIFVKHQIRCQINQWKYWLYLIHIKNVLLDSALFLAFSKHEIWINPCYHFLIYGTPYHLINLYATTISLKEWNTICENNFFTETYPKLPLKIFASHWLDRLIKQEFAK